MTDKDDEKKPAVDDEKPDAKAKDDADTKGAADDEEKPGPYRAVGVRPGDVVTPWDRAWESWDFPAFARTFPRDPALDELVIAFAQGDFKRVSAEAPKVARSADSEDVKNAVRLLVERTRPDPAAKIFFLLTAALLAFLTIWWATHDGPPKDTPAPTKPVPTVEYVN